MQSTVAVAVVAVFTAVASIAAAPGGDDLRDLSLAIRQGNLDAVQALVAKTPSLVTSADDGGYTALHIAATSGNVAIIEFLLQHGAAIEARTGGGQTPLFQTVPLVSQQAFLYLLSKGADVNARDNNGRNILEFALRWRRSGMVDLILSKGFPIHAEGAAARDMLEEAANTGMEKLVAALVAKGVLAATELRDGTTLLHSAARGGLAWFAERLVQRGATIGVRDRHGLTPLHVAAFHGREAVIRVLLANGADIQARAADGRSPLHLAEYAGQATAVALLASKGARRAPAVFPALSGPYLGLAEPGAVPQVFAPGIISSEEHETNIAFTPDGLEWCFSRINGDQTRRWMLIMREERGRWLVPQPVPFATSAAEFEGAYSADGRQLFFSSNRAVAADAPAKRDMDIWVAQRAAGGWGDPRNLGPAVNGASNEYMPSVDREGNLYFERYGLNRARWQNGTYLPAEKIDVGTRNVVNPGHPFVAPDGSYILFDARRPGSDMSLLFVSFQQKDGTWSPPARVFEQADTREYESCPTVSPDGRFLFFGRDHDIYWVSADIIERLRPRHPL